MCASLKLYHNPDILILRLHIELDVKVLVARNIAIRGQGYKKVEETL